MPLGNIITTIDARIGHHGGVDHDHDPAVNLDDPDSDYKIDDGIVVHLGLEDFAHDSGLGRWEVLMAPSGHDGIYQRPFHRNLGPDHLSVYFPTLGIGASSLDQPHHQIRHVACAL